MAWVFVDPAAAATDDLIAIGTGGVGLIDSRATIRVTVGTTNFQVGGRSLDTDPFITLNGGTLTTSVWTHIAGVLDYANDTLELYQDGVSVAFASAVGFGSTSSDSTNPKNGHLAAQDDGSAGFFDGRLGDCRVYGRALTADEIQTIYQTRGVDKIVSGLEQRWMQEELNPGSIASGAGFVKDIGPVPRDGTPVASPIYIADELRSRRRVA